MKKEIITRIKPEVTLVCPRGHDILVETNEVLNHARRVWGCAECAQGILRTGLIREMESTKVMGQLVGGIIMLNDMK